MTRRKNTEVIGRQFRRVRPDARHMTLFNHTTLTKFNCRNCKQEFLISEAYMESASKRKHNEQIRQFCTTCWSLTYGKINKKESSDALFPEEWFN